MPYISNEELKKRVQTALSKYSKEYSVIDPLIEPLCNLLNECDYYTLHSCQGHINENAEQSNTWYVVFTTNNSMNPFHEIAEELVECFDMRVTIDYMIPMQGLSKRYYIGQRFPHHFTEHDIVAAHQTIFERFQKHLTK